MSRVKLEVVRERAGHCPRCGAARLGRRRRPNHLLHLVLTLLTGLWVLIWIWSAITSESDPYRCVFCGTPLRPRSDKPQEAEADSSRGQRAASLGRAEAK